VEGNPYEITKIARLLRVRERGNIFRSGVVEAHKRPGTIKGVLMIKDRFLDQEELRLVAALAPAHRLGAVRRVEMVDVYCDTAAHDLLRAGLAFRVRRTPAGMRVTLKSLDRPGFEDLLLQRLEVEGPVADPAWPLDPQGWPAVVHDRVAQAADLKAGLEPFCVLRQIREMYDVVAVAAATDDDPAAAGPALAELSVDEVAVYAPDGLAADPTLQTVPTLLAAGTPVGHFVELEVELRPAGSRSALRDMARRLTRQLGLVPVRGSKLERAMYLLADQRHDGGLARPGADPARTAAGGIVPAMPMAAAGRLMWRRQLATMILNEAGARRGQDIEYVHDMRVATRRARAVARLFGAYFRPKDLKPFLKDLRHTARALGTVRDLDVALAKLKKHVQDLPAAEQGAHVELAAEWRILRRQAYRELLEWLDSPDYRRFMVRFIAFCRAPDAAPGDVIPTPDRPPVPHQVRHVMPSAILNRFEQVRAYEPLFEAGIPVPVMSLHALRIDCKALRYSLEPVEHLLGPDGAKLVTQLKVLQDLLGDLNDAAVMRARLLEMQLGGLPPEGAAAYLAHQERLLADLTGRVPATWRSFTGPENRRRLALAIARL